ncbi:MAG: SulP family inorganic anion transporter, partial [Fimbriimonadaceae bacterium]|nr:SulP family inorganic anion transporter [Fimbriimonadaceae bacterium]
PATIIGLLAFGIMVGWQYMPKQIKAVPSALVSVAVCTAIASFGNLDLARVKLSDGGDLIKLPIVPSDQIQGVIVGGLIIALVASVESLLSAVATDRLHTGPRANLDKELIGQGIANTVSGALGGLPVTGVIVRSSANIASGARSNLSATLHGVWIVVCVGALSTALEKIPLAALAGLLCFVGTKLVNVEHIRELAKHKELPVYVVTVLGVVGLDLLKGVGLGLGLAIFLLIRRLAHLEIRVDDSPEVQTIHLDGSLTFATVPKLSRELQRVRPGVLARIEMHADFMDHAAYEALHSWEVGHLRTGGDVEVIEHHQDWYRTVKEDGPRIMRSTVRANEKPIAVLAGMGPAKVNEP